MNNMLIQACRLYLECDYIIASLKALANFTYKVTMPFLNCVEKTDQNELVVILPQLYADLSASKMDTLKDYHVKWTHIEMEKQQPSNNLENYLLKEMCVTAAEGVKMQCAREYWGDERNPRVTELHKMTSDERKNLPSENLVCERYLAKFGYLASISAARSNKFFKAQRIRDDLMFNVTEKNEEDVKKSCFKIIKSLQEMEVEWTKSQKEVSKKRVQESLKKKQHKNDYADVILQRCKQHNGPITNTKELKDFVKKTSNNETRKHRRNEIIFQRLIHPIDAKERPYLYKVNDVNTDQLLENFAILLEQPGDHNETEADVEFPSFDEIMKIIQEKVDEGEPNLSDELFEFQQPLAIVWDQSDGTRKWYIGFYLGNNEDMLRVDHLIGAASEWKRPAIDDIQNETSHQQIVPCPVIGESVFNKRSTLFKVENVVDIQLSFEEHFN